MDDDLLLSDDDFFLLPLSPPPLSWFDLDLDDFFLDLSDLLRLLEPDRDEAELVEDEEEGEDRRWDLWLL